MHLARFRRHNTRCNNNLPSIVSSNDGRFVQENDVDRMVEPSCSYAVSSRAHEALLPNAVPVDAANYICCRNQIPLRGDGRPFSETDIKEATNVCCKRCAYILAPSLHFISQMRLEGRFVVNPLDLSAIVRG